MTVMPMQAAPRRRGGRIRQPAAERRRLLDAMAVLACERPWSGLPVHRICEPARVSRAVFFEHFVDAEDCFASTVEDALDRLGAAVDAEVGQAGPEWPDQVSAAITGFLGFLQADPARAWMSIVEPLGGSARVSDARQAAIGRFTTLLQSGPVADDDRDRDRVAVGTVAGTVGGLWEMARHYLSADDETVGIDDVARSAIFLALTPYLGRDAAMRHAFTARTLVEVTPEGSPSAAGDVDEVVLVAAELTELASATVGYLEAHPGAPNDAVARAIGIEHKSQASRHLRSLADRGLVDAQKRGCSNAWALTALGRRVAAYLGRA